MLCGYDSVLIPFLIYIGNNRNTGNNIFNNGAEKIFITQQIGQGSQTEGITFFNNEKYYLSREEVNSNGFHFPAKLYEFKSDFFSLLSINETQFLNQVDVFPNPTSSKISIVYPKQETLEKIIVYNYLRKQLLSQNISKNQVDFSLFTSGIYFMKIIFKNKNPIFKKIIKL